MNYNNDPLFRFLEAQEGVQSCFEDSVVGGMCASKPPVAQDNCLRGRSLAMVYSPCQDFVNVYEPMAALSRGTLFAELDKPFCAGGR